MKKLVIIFLLLPAALLSVAQVPGTPYGLPATVPATPGAITLSATSVCLNGMFTASVTAVPGATSYVWTLPSGLTGTSTSNSITIQGSTAGTYATGTVKVAAKNNAGTSAASNSAEAISVVAAPATPGAITLGAATVNLNGTFTASISAVSGATSYVWTLPSGLTGSSTGTLITITGTTSGSKDASGITVKAKNDCGESAAKSGSGTITVRNCEAAPATPGAISFSTTTVNLNGSFTASISAVSGATSYVWTLPPGLTGSSTGTSITINGALVGSYPANGIAVEATNDCGASAAETGSGTITVRSCSAVPATPGIMTLSSTQVSPGQTLIASVPSEADVTYSWLLPTGLTGSSSTSSIEISATEPGKMDWFSLKVRAENACGASDYRNAPTDVYFLYDVVWSTYCVQSNKAGCTCPAGYSARFWEDTDYTIRVSGNYNPVKACTWRTAAAGDPRGWKSKADFTSSYSGCDADEYKKLFCIR